MNLKRTPTFVMTYPPLLRAWSVLTCGAAFLTVLVGTLVTTFHVGMTDPLWPTAPWHLLLIESVPNFGFYVEHAHRIVGYLIGAFILVQMLALWRSSPSPIRRWASLVLTIAVGGGIGVGMRLVKIAPERSLDALVNVGFLAAAVGAAAFLALAGWEVASQAAGRWQRAFVTVMYLGVIAQGMLGGLRVYLNELRGPELAVIHGLLAQLVVALSAVLALMTTTRWNSLTELLAEPPLRKLTAATVGLLIVQIVFGGLLRHLSMPIAHRLHPLLAFAVAVTVTLILVRIFAFGEGWVSLRRTAVLLGVLVGLQVVLGIEAWLRHVSAAATYAPVEIAEAFIRSLHVLTGFGVFATATLLAARSWKAKLI